MLVRDMVLLLFLVFGTMLLWFVMVCSCAFFCVKEPSSIMVSSVQVRFQRKLRGQVNACAKSNCENREVRTVFSIFYLLHNKPGVRYWSTYTVRWTSNLVRTSRILILPEEAKEQRPFTTTTRPLSTPYPRLLWLLRVSTGTLERRAVAELVCRCSRGNSWFLGLANAIFGWGTLL